MTRDEHCALLERYGWTIICKDPFEIEKIEDGVCVATATGQAAFTIAYHLEEVNTFPDELTLEELNTRTEVHHLTVKELKEAIKDKADDAVILVERIEDRYYQKHGWRPVYVKGEQYHSFEEFNKKLDDKKGYPHMTKSGFKKVDLDDKLLLDQFTPAWCACGGGDADPKNVYIHLHY